MTKTFSQVLFLLEQEVRSSAAADSQQSFFDGTIWLLMIVPLVATFLLAWYNKKSKQRVREFTDEDFERDVLGAHDPVLVHFYREWSIGDQCMIAQVENMASRKPPYDVGFVNVDRNRGVMERFPHVEPPALLFFINGERVFQSKGVFDGEDVHVELMDIMERHQRRGAMGQQR